MSTTDTPEKTFRIGNPQGKPLVIIDRGEGSSLRYVVHNAQSDLKDRRTFQDLRKLASYITDNIGSNYFDMPESVGSQLPENLRTAQSQR